MRRRTLWHFLIALVVGLIAGVIAWFTTQHQFGPSIAWDAIAITFILLKWREVRGFDAEQTHRYAAEEDSSRVIDEMLVLFAAIVSLLTVAFVLSNSSGTPDLREKLVRTGLGIISVVLGWAVVHTVYTLRYARMYYTEPVGGIDFKGPEQPRYIDFAYMAFGIGMAFQIGDTELQDRSFRSIVLRHELLSFLFGTVILATTINLVAGLNS